MANRTRKKRTVRHVRSKRLPPAMAIQLAGESLVRALENGADVGVELSGFTKVLRAMADLTELAGRRWYNEILNRQEQEDRRDTLLESMEVELSQ